MDINGVQYGLLYSVGAEAEIARLCPGEDLRRIRETLSGGTADAIDRNAELVCILSRWHELAMHFADPEYRENPLTREIVALLPVAAFAELQKAALATILADGRTTVEAETEKKRRGPKIELNRAWYLFYGRTLGMEKREILITRVGEMRDMIACLSIYHGATPKTKKREMGFLETLGVM